VLRVRHPPLRLLRLANPVVRGVLDSPAHRILSGTLVVLAYRGHKSGREFRIPLRYTEEPDHRIVALAVQPERKLWWLSFADAAQATLLIRGESRPVTGRVVDGAERRAALDAYLTRYPRAAGALGVPRSRSSDDLDGAAAAAVVFEPGG
jgi:hypothetical protein